MAKLFFMEYDDLLLTIGLAGGKGAALARMAGRGIPIPEGFIITTTAYGRFVRDNGIDERIFSLLQGIDEGSPAAWQAAESEILAWFAQGEIADDLLDELNGRLAREEGYGVAVRSSATAEDLPEASFAGLQETFLNAAGQAAIWKAIRETWASLWTARAMRYRALHGIAPQSVSMAVVVQRMVPAIASGVLFSVNPLDGDHGQMLITSTWGLGAPLVGGEITPDSFTVNKEPYKLLSRQIADKPAQLLANPSGQGTLQVGVPAHLRKQPSLKPTELMALMRWGLILEQEMACPVDVEWAIGRDGPLREVQILQARPITQLPQQPVRWRQAKKGLVYSRAGLAEHTPNPVTPLFGSLAIGAFNVPTAQLAAVIMGNDDEYTYKVVNGYVYLCMRKRNLSLRGLLHGTKRSLWKDFLDSRACWQNALHDLRASVRMVEQQDLPSETSLRLLESARGLLRATGKYFTRLQVSTLPAAVVSEIVFVSLQHLCWDRQHRPTERLLFGLDTQVLRGEKLLFDIAQWLPEHAAEVATLLLAGKAASLANAMLGRAAPPMEVPARQWNDFVDRFELYVEETGYSAFDMDISRPTPAEIPVVAMGLLASYLRGEARNPYHWQNECDGQRADWLAHMEEVLVRPPMSWLYRSLNWACECAVDKEDSMASLNYAYPLLRMLFLELGNRLARAGVLPAAADIYWLLEDELEEIIGRLVSRQTIPPYDHILELRKEEWQHTLRLNPPRLFPQSVWLEQLVPWMARPARPPGQPLKGVAASPGCYTGTARVVVTPEDFGLLEPGDVLVAATTTPAWTPLFATAKAIVTDIGGPLGHSSIIAREYGLPAVVATGNASRRILSGQMVRVDGDNGTVLVLTGKEGYDSRRTGN